MDDNAGEPWYRTQGTMSVEESSSDASNAVSWYDEHAEPMVERHESLAQKRLMPGLRSFCQVSRLLC